MLDIRFIRENSARVKEATKQKGYQVDIDRLLQLDDSRRELRIRVESLRARRNALAAGLKQGKPSQAQLAEGRELKTTLSEQEEHLRVVEADFTALLRQVPNMPSDDVPIGASEAENVVIKTVGEPPAFDFSSRTHWQIAEARGWIDKERAAKVAGTRFAYIKGELALLQFALMQFTTAQLTDPDVVKKIVQGSGLQVDGKPFVPVLPPAVIRTDVYEDTARLNSEEVTYKLADDELWLNASAEHSLCPMYKDEILAEADLPIRYLGFTTAFRREAGTYGKDAEGIFRMHQFDKLEMESFTTAETSLDEHHFFVAVQEYLLQQLGLPYRVLLKCTADIGGPNARGVDIDTWLPGQGAYRETHTADYITDYQARRLSTRVRRASGVLELLHTNDATAFALGRAMIAIIENFQQADNTVLVPEVLRPYLSGRETL